MITAVLIVLGLSGAVVSDQAPTTEASRWVQTLQQRRDALQLSVRQVKGKGGGNESAVAALEKQFDTLCAGVDRWQKAALSSETEARTGLDDMAKTTARAMAQFARDARAYVDGIEGRLQERSVALFEDEMKSAARAFSRADQATRDAAAKSIAWMPWNSIQ
jgi:hypothetical protein